MTSSSPAPTPPFPPPPELKPLHPFLQRSRELITRDPPMAYWCLYSAAKLGIGSKCKDKESNVFLGSVLDCLEELKRKLAGNDAVTSDEAGSAYVENFALKVFVGADNDDRAGKADMATAKRFLAAATFLELLDIFGQFTGDAAEKAKYAKWKAAEIAKAIREGRRPDPGPPGWDPEEDARQRKAIEEAQAAADAEAAPADDEDALLAREIERLTAPAGSVEVASPAAAPAPEQQQPPQHQNQQFLEPSALADDDDDGVPIATAISPPPGDENHASSQTRHNRRAPARLSFDASTSLDAFGFGGGASGAIDPQQPQPQHPHAHPTTPPHAAANRSLSPAAGAAPASGAASPSPNFSHPLRPQFQKRMTGGSHSSSSGGGGDATASPFDPTVAAPTPAPAPGTHPHFLGLPPSHPSTPGLPPAPAAPAPAGPTATSPTPGAVTAPGRPLPVPPGASTSAQNLHDVFGTAAASAAVSTAATAASPPAPAPLPQVPSAAPSAPPAPSAPATAPTAPSAPALTAPLPESLSPQLTTRAQKAAKYAVSALDYDDLHTARRHLREALDVVEGRMAGA